MIYLNPHLATQAHVLTLGAWPRSSAVAALVLASVLGLLLFRPLTAGPPASTPQFLEQMRLQGLVATLRDEGAVIDLAPCHGRDLCVRVTPLFRGLDRGDKRTIGRGLQRYAETRPGDPLPVRRVRFLDAATGLELGRYALGRLEWEGRS